MAAITLEAAGIERLIDRVCPPVLLPSGFQQVYSCH
jgi:hypothetical protein